MKPTKEDLKRYADNFRREQEGIALYRALADAEKNPARAEIFERLAKADKRSLASYIEIALQKHIDGEAKPTKGRRE